MGDFLGCGAERESVTAHGELVGVISTSAGAFQTHDIGQRDAGIASIVDCLGKSLAHPYNVARRCMIWMLLMIKFRGAASCQRSLNDPGEWIELGWAGHADFRLLVVEFFKLAEERNFAQVRLIGPHMLKLAQDFLRQFERLIFRDNQANQVGIVGLLSPDHMAFAYGEFVIFGRHVASSVIRFNGLIVLR